MNTNPRPRAWWFKAGRPAATTGWWTPSGNRHYFNNSAQPWSTMRLDVDGISYHFDATGAPIEQKDADGNVTVVATASSSSRRRPSLACGGSSPAARLSSSRVVLCSCVDGILPIPMRPRCASASPLVAAP